jgi:hypothetical protein
MLVTNAKTRIIPAIVGSAILFITYCLFVTIYEICLKDTIDKQT